MNDYDKLKQEYDILYKQNYYAQKHIVEQHEKLMKAQKRIEELENDLCILRRRLSDNKK